MKRPTPEAGQVTVTEGEEAQEAPTPAPKRPRSGRTRPKGRLRRSGSGRGGKRSGDRRVRRDRQRSATPSPPERPRQPAHEARAEEGVEVLGVEAEEPGSARPSPPPSSAAAAAKERAAERQAAKAAAEAAANAKQKRTADADHVQQSMGLMADAAEADSPSASASERSSGGTPEPRASGLIASGAPALLLETCRLIALICMRPLQQNRASLATHMCPSHTGRAQLQAGSRRGAALLPRLAHAVGALQP